MRDGVKHIASDMDNLHQFAILGLAFNALFTVLIRFWPKRTFDRHRVVYVNRVIYVCLCLSAAITVVLSLSSPIGICSFGKLLIAVSSWPWIVLVGFASHLILVRLPVLLILRVRDESFASEATEFARFLDGYVDPAQDEEVVGMIISLERRFSLVLQSYYLDLTLSDLREEINGCSNERLGSAPAVASAVRASVLRLADDTRSVFSDFDQVLQIAGFGIILVVLTSLAT